DQSRRGSLAVRPQCEGGECAECTALAEVRPRASGMGIYGNYRHGARTKATIELSLRCAGTDKPIGIIEPTQNEAMPVQGGRVEGKMSNNPMHKAHAAPRCTARSKQTGQPFGIRIRAGDKAQHRTFIAQYKIGEKHRRITLGDVRKVTLENARREARRIFGSVVNGHDPANEKAERRSAASHTLDATIAR